MFKWNFIQHILIMNQSQHKERSVSRALRIQLVGLQNHGSFIACLRMILKCLTSLLSHISNIKNLISKSDYNLLLNMHLF